MADLARILKNSSGINPKENGRLPEDDACREGNTSMQNVMEARAESKNPSDMFRRNSPEKNAGLWLDERIARSKAGVITEIVELTPALARVLLARNPDNRKVSATVVENYARDMASGSWAFNGEPIIVSNTGQLNDGQHRCEAVLAANVTIPAIVVIGTDRSSRLTVDQGKTRMAGDYLGMNGHPDSIALAAAAKYVWQHRNHGKLSHQKLMSPTKSEVLALVETTPTIANSLKSIQSKGSDAVGGRSILCFLHWTFSRVSGNRAATDLFFDALINGSNLTVRSPILYARNRLMAERGRIKPNEKAELIIRAWNASRRGDKVASLPIKGGALPVVER